MPKWMIHHKMPMFQHTIKRYVVFRERLVWKYCLLQHDCFSSWDLHSWLCNYTHSECLNLTLLDCAFLMQALHCHCVTQTRNKSCINVEKLSHKHVRLGTHLEVSIIVGRYLPCSLYLLPGVASNSSSKSSSGSFGTSLSKDKRSKKITCASRLC